MLYRVLRFAIRVVLRLGFTLDVREAHRVPERGPVLLVANHMSVLDPPVVGCATGRQLDFLAKRELFRVPVLGWLIGRVGAHPVRRDGHDAAALRTGLTVLRRGGALLIFPEGTRGGEGTLGPAHEGAGMLAVASGVPVLPVLIEGSGHAWPRQRRLPRRARIRVSFGEVLELSQVPGGRREQYRAAGMAMMAAIAALRRGPLPAVGGTATR